MTKTGKTGKRPTAYAQYDGQRETVRSIEESMFGRLSREAPRPLAPFAVGIGQLSSEIHSDERRLRHLSALVASAINGANPWRTTPTFLSLINCNEDGKAIVPERTIQHFADEAPTVAGSSIYYYLRMIETLLTYKHPCCHHHVFEALIAQYDDIEKLQRVFYTARHGENSDELRLSGMMAGALNLYNVLERMNGHVDQARLKALKKSPLLGNIPYSSRKGSLPKLFVCARPSAVKGELVVSTVEFTIIRSTFEPDPEQGGAQLDRDEKIAIYSEIYLPPSRGSDRGGPVSVGYVVPREHGIYVLNHLQVDAGFNFTAFSTAELTEERLIKRGILMALNRGGNSSPAMTPVVMIEATAEVSSSLGRDISLSAFRNALQTDYGESEGGAMATELENYLFGAGNVEVETMTDGIRSYESFSDYVSRSIGAGAPAARLVTRKPFVAPTND